MAGGAAVSPAATAVAATATARAAPGGLAVVVPVRVPVLFLAVRGPTVRPAVRVPHQIHAGLLPSLLPIVLPPVLALRLQVMPAKTATRRETIQTRVIA